MGHCVRARVAFPSSLSLSPSQARKGKCAQRGATGTSRASERVTLETEDRRREKREREEPRPGVTHEGQGVASSDTDVRISELAAEGGSRDGTQVAREMCGNCSGSSEGAAAADYSSSSSSSTHSCSPAATRSLAPLSLSLCADSLHSLAPLCRRRSPLLLFSLSLSFPPLVTFRLVIMSAATASKRTIDCVNVPGERGSAVGRPPERRP